MINDIKIYEPKISTTSTSTAQTDFYKLLGYTTTYGCSALKSIFNFEPKDIIFNDEEKMVIVKWSDDSKTIVKCNEDTYDRRTGFLIAYFQKASGLSKNKANKYLESIIEKDDLKKEKLKNKKTKTIELPEPKGGYSDNVGDEDLVFSALTFNSVERDKLDLHDWKFQCDGLTESEMDDIGMSTDKEWMIPRKDFVPYTKK